MSEAVLQPAAPVRDAASIILLRRDGGRPQVLMGQRGAAAVFMPDKFVFPGGAVDASDLSLAHETAPDPRCLRRLGIDASPELARALPMTAIRELWEETGLRLGRPDPAAVARGAGPWRGFFAAGLRPSAEALRFVFRAVTPPGRPRRFDARFFLAEASAVHGDMSDFSCADCELSRLQWLDLDAARALPLPFITSVVLSELEALLADPEGARPAPYFRHDERGSHFRLI